MSGRVSLWLSGSLCVRLSGTACSQVVSALHQSSIPLYDVRVEGTTCTLEIALPHFSALYRVCRRHRVKIRFLERRGLPFVARVLLRRKFLVGGAGAFIVLLVAASSMVWQVSVVGANPDQIQTVLAAARESGLYPGVWKHRLRDVNDIQRALLAKLPGAIWVGVRVVGVKAEIEVVEKIPGVTAQSATPSDIRVTKPGVIQRVIAERGVALVHPGQAVVPGQIAISGNLGDGTKQVAARGEVLAEVWYKSTVEVPLTVRPAGLTGASVTRDYLTTGGFHVRVWGWSEPGYKNAVARDTETDWHIGRWRLPIQWQQVQLQQVVPQVWQRSVTQAELVALDMARADVRRQAGKTGVVLGQTVLHRQVSRGNLYETVMTRTEEDIGAPAAMAPLQPNEQTP